MRWTFGRFSRTRMRKAVVFMHPFFGGGESQGRSTRPCRSRLSVCGVVVVVALAGGAACTSSGTVHPRRPGQAGSTSQLSAPAVSATPTLSSANDRPLPLDNYMPTAEQLRVFGSAYDQLISSCMHRFGFASWSSDAAGGVVLPSASALRLSGHYGVQSMDQARTFGYHGNGGGGNGDGKGGGSGPSPTLMEWQALMGSRSMAEKFGPGGQRVNGQVVPDHGCVGEAYTALTGSADGSKAFGDPQFAFGLMVTALARSEQDSRVRAVFAKWSQCMRDSGYDYPTPLDPPADRRWAGTAEPTQREIQTAVADQRCRARYNVVGVWYAVDRAFEEQVVEANAERLRSIKEDLENQMKAAAHALGSG